MPHAGLGQATLALAGQTLTRLTELTGSLDFLRARALAKFPDAIQAQGNLLRLNCVCKNRPPFCRRKRERLAGRLFVAGKCFNF